MQRSEIIELSNQLTERKAEKVLNTQSLYRFVVQDICKREAYWWRRMQVSLSLTPGANTYDLTSVATNPALTEILFEQITKFTIVLTPGTQQSPSSLQTAELTPIFDPEAVIEMTFNNSLGFSQQPGRYTMQPGDYKTVMIDNPDLNYNAFISGWAIANPGSDSANDNVPLIPAWGHNTIVAGMNAKIFKFAYGSKNEKTIDAQEEYEQGLQDLMQRRQFDPNYRLQMTLSEAAVRST